MFLHTCPFSLDTYIQCMELSKPYKAIQTSLHLFFTGAASGSTSAKLFFPNFGFWATELRPEKLQNKKLTLNS